MKIRNGFVSNSSSSSFILGYDEDKVLNGPEEILAYVMQNPDNKLIIYGHDLSDGDDIFELSEEDKQLLKQFSDEFIKINKNFSRYDWEKDITVKGLKAYPEAILKEVPYTAFSIQEENADKKTLEKIKSEVLGKINGSHPVVQNVLIDYDAISEYSNSDRTFASAYLTEEYTDEHYELGELCKYNDVMAQPFAIIYDKAIEDKIDILDILKAKPKNCYLTWYNKVFNDQYTKAVDLDLFKLDSKEIEIIKNNKEKFLSNKRPIILYTEAKVVRVKGKAIIGNMVLNFGKCAVIKSGTEVDLFKKIMLSSDSEN